MAPPVVLVAGLTREFLLGSTTVHALRGVDLTIEQGELVAVMGASGSGKSTLMNLLGCLDRPTGGSLRIDGVAVDTLDDDALAALRNAKIGFVFQGFNLLPRTTALENVALPLLYDRRRRVADPVAAARDALVRVGLGDRLDHRPNELSGGQQQRVAIARALVTSPALVLADEPTGNLDTATTAEIMALFQALNDDGVTLVIVTHEDDVAARCGRVVTLRDGRVISDVPGEHRRAGAP